MKGAEARVLFLADHLGHPGGLVHGVTTYLLDVLPALRRFGMCPAACFLRERHPAAESLLAQGVPVYFLRTSRFDPFVISTVEHLVRRGGFSILHCTQFRSSVVGRMLARASKHVRALVHVHDLTLPPGPVRTLNRIVANPADLGICVSRAVCEVAVRGYFLPRTRLRVLYTGVDTSTFRALTADERAAARDELGIAGAKALCLVGRFNPVKGHHDMIKMLPALLACRSDYILLLVGDGPCRAACERLAARLGVANRVRFLGQRHDVARIVGAADVAVLPSQSEGLSRAAIEANLCGIPAVGYRTGGLAEALTEPLGGELVSPGNAEAFVAATNRLCDAGAAGSSQDRARRAAQQFGLEQHVQALRECYEELGA